MFLIEKDDEDQNNSKETVVVEQQAPVDNDYGEGGDDHLPNSQNQNQSVLFSESFYKIRKIDGVLHEQEVLEYDNEDDGLTQQSSMREGGGFNSE